jgi:hypothetical protein
MVAHCLQSQHLGVETTRAGGMVQAREHLPSKCKALNSIPSTVKNNKVSSTPAWGYIGKLSLPKKFAFTSKIDTEIHQMWEEET